MNGHPPYRRVPQISSQHESACGNRRPSEIVATAPPTASRALSPRPDRRRTSPRARARPAAGAVTRSICCAEQPAHLVDLVYAHVDCDSTAVGPERSRRRLLVPLHARQLVDLAQLTGFDSRPELAQLGHEPPPIADLEHHPGLRAPRRVLRRPPRARPRPASRTAPGCRPPRTG